MKANTRLMVIVALAISAAGCSKPKSELPDMQLACSGTLTQTSAKNNQDKRVDSSDKSESYLLKRTEVPDTSTANWVLDNGNKKYYTNAPKSRLNVDDRVIRYTADELEPLTTTAHGKGKKRVAMVIEIDRVSGDWMSEHRVEKEFTNGDWETDIEQIQGQCRRTDRKF